jgi:lambda family phage tail tape measure protein
MGNNVTVTINGQNNLGPKLNEAKGQLSGFEGAVESLQGALEKLGVALLVDKLVEFGKSTLEAADNIAKMSERTGVSVQDLGGLQHAAALSDVSMQSLEKGLRKLSTTLSDARAGNQQAKDNLHALGIEATGASGGIITTTSALSQIADKMASTQNNANKTALAMKVFGKSGSDLIPMLNEGSAGLQKMQDEAKRLGLVMTDEDATAIEGMNDNLTRLKEVTQGLIQNFLAGLAPAVNQIADALSGPGTEGFNLMRDAGTFLGDVLKYLLLGFESLAIGIDFAAHKFGLFTDAVWQLAHADISGAMDKLSQMLGLSNDEQGEQLKNQLGSFQNSLFGSASGEKKNRAGGGDDLSRPDENASAIAKARAEQENAIAKAAADYRKAVAQDEMQYLDDLRAHDLISVQDWYDQKKALAIEQANADIAALQSEIATEEKLSQTAPKEQDRIVALGKLNTLTEQLTVKETELNRLRNQAPGGGADPLAVLVDQMKLAAAEAQDLETKINAVFTNLQLNEQRIKDLVTNRQLTETQGETQINALRADASKQLDGMITKYDQLAQASGDPRLIENARRLDLEHQELAHTINSLRDTVLDSATQGFENFFSSIVTGTETAGQAMLQFAQTVLGAIAQIIAKMIALWAIQQLTGLFFAGASSSSVGAGGPSIGGGGLGSGFSFAPRASGGPVAGGSPYLFVPGQSGVIIPNGQLGKGGGGTNIYIDARGADPGSEQRIQALMRRTHDLSVLDSFNVVQQDKQRN